MALEAEVAKYEKRFPCEHDCLDAPEEDCSRHGRTPSDLWNQIDVVRQQRDDALDEVADLRATVARVREGLDRMESGGINCACGHNIGGEHNSLGCYARISHEPLVTCSCTRDCDQSEADIAVGMIRSVLDGAGER